MKKKYEFQIGSAYPVSLWADRADFEVRYGKQTKSGLSYGEAARELGAALMHAMACERIINND